jgi:inner membrane protein
LDNLTHSLVGATLAELALPVGAPRATRRTFFVAGVLAANLPDADLVYTRITPAPLGALLHHRGHTHTVAGLFLLGLAIAAVCLLPRIRSTIAPVRGRFWALVAIALASHLVLDSWNSYGVHPFWPFSSRWFYGDAVFILEPWIWMLLGVAAVLNTTNRVGRLLLAAVLIGLLPLGRRFGVIAPAALVALVVVAALLAALLLRRTPRVRAAVALALVTIFVGGLFVLREVARGEVLATMAPASRARVADIILSSEASNPFCWSVLTVVRDPGDASYLMTRGSVAVVAPGACGTRGRVSWDPPVAQSIVALRARARADCWVRGWLQFGRAPHMSDVAISDERYGGVPRGNFTTMALKPPAEAARCPAHLTAWRPPRQDLLGEISARGDQEPQ